MPTSSNARGHGGPSDGQAHLEATHPIRPLELSALMDMHRRAAPAARDGDDDDGFNRAFHETLYRSTQNGVLAEEALAIRTRLSAFRRTQLRHDARIHRSHDELGEILAAITEGDGDAAAGRMRAHMLNAAGALRLDILQHG